MSDKQKVECWIAINSDGDYEVGTYDEEAIERFESNIQSSTAGIRLVRLTASITLPEYVEVDVDVPDDAGTIVEASAEESPEATP